MNRAAELAGVVKLGNNRGRSAQELARFNWQAQLRTLIAFGQNIKVDPELIFHLYCASTNADGSNAKVSLLDGASSEIMAIFPS